MGNRLRIPRQMETEILTRCRRRCCLCYFLEHRQEERPGQIAHLDQDHNNNEPENLAYLCLEHHNRYDSRTSQAKGFTRDEVKYYRDRLHAIFSGPCDSGRGASGGPDSGAVLDVLADLPAPGRLGDILRGDIGRSRWLPLHGSPLPARSGGMVLTAVNALSRAMPAGACPARESAVWPAGDADQPPTRFLWKGGTWELSTFFHFHNLTSRPVRLYDLHSRLYHVSGGRSLGSVVVRPRICITQDNSILRSGREHTVEARDMLPFELVLHTSAFDTGQTTAVWGIVAEAESVDGDRIIRSCIPSDCIFVFQHDSDWGPGRCSFLCCDCGSLECPTRRSAVERGLGASAPLRRILDLHAGARRDSAVGGAPGRSGRRPGAGE
jgi:hypothetical protein